MKFIKQLKKLIVISTCCILISPLAQAQLRIDNAQVRLLPPVVKNTAAFFTLTNTSQQDIHLISASSNISERVEFHDHVMKNNAMSMVHLPQLIIPANQTIELSSGGIHLMFINLHSPLKAEQLIQFELIDNTEKRYTFTASVNAPNKHLHHHH